VKPSHSPDNTSHKLLAAAKLGTICVPDHKNSPLAQKFGVMSLGAIRGATRSGAACTKAPSKLWNNWDPSHIVFVVTIRHELSSST